MGKIYKAVTPAHITTTPTVNISVPIPNTTPYTPQVVPLDKFNTILEEAQKLIDSQQYIQALPFLLNLEITDFNHIGVHELLADVYLHLNQIELAKEQCQIYARLLPKNDITENHTQLKSFDELYQEAGNFEDIQQEFQQLQSQEVTPDNFYHGTNIALKMATHYMAQNRFQDAEKLLIVHRDRYIHFLEKEGNKEIPN